jgi:hypothetical protein
VDYSCSGSFHKFLVSFSIFYIFRSCVGIKSLVRFNLLLLECCKGLYPCWFCLFPLRFGTAFWFGLSRLLLFRILPVTPTPFSRHRRLCSVNPTFPSTHRYNFGAQRGGSSGRKGVRILLLNQVLKYYHGERTSKNVLRRGE